MTQFWREPDKMQALGVTDNPEPYINKMSCFCDFEVPQSYGITNKKRVVGTPEMVEISEVAIGIKGQFDIEQVVTELRVKYNIPTSFSRNYINRHQIRVYLFTNVCLGKLICELKYVKINKRATFKEMFQWVGTNMPCPKMIATPIITKKGKNITNTKCDFRWRQDGHFKQKPGELDEHK